MKPDVEAFKRYAVVGGGCFDCPYGEPVDRQMQDDMDEQHFACTLLDRAVWGEDSPCTPCDWYAAAIAAP